MGTLQDCVVVNGRYFCWNTETADIVEVKVEPLNTPLDKETRETAMKAVAMRRWLQQKPETKNT